MSLHFPILIGLSKCTPGLSIPARVPDKNDLSRAFGGTLRRFPRRARPASCQRQQSVMESRGCFWFSMRSSETPASLYLPSLSSSQSPVPFYTLASHSASNKQVNISMQVHPPGWTHADTQAPRHLHKFTWFAHINASADCTHKHTGGRRLKVSTVKPILSVFLCALFPSVLVFFTPPVTMCHHLPSQRQRRRYLQTLPEKHSGPKSCPWYLDFAAQVLMLT